MLRRTLRCLEKLVIVESPNKVIKVEGLLSDPKVISDWSFGNVALEEISSGPEKAMAMATTGHFMSLKELSWTPQIISARPPEEFPANGMLASFALEWEILPGRRIQETISHYVKEKADHISEIIIATDPDREGELIAVHALNLLQRMFPKMDVPFTRAYMHSITEDGIRAAMRDRRRTFDIDLANAAEARHAMDRMFGFLGSSVVRHANPQMRSIGRVQTPALILVSEREQRIEKFLADHELSYCVKTLCTFPAKAGVEFTQLVEVVPSDTRTVQAKDWTNRSTVQSIMSQWQLEAARDFKVASCVVTPNVSEPPKPFTMASIISKANRQLHLSSEVVSSSLQDLFQMGFITYPRTDSTRIDESALQRIYEVVAREHGKAAVYRLDERDGESGTGKSASAGRRRKSKQAEATSEPREGNVEDAHEAIRPTDMFLTKDSIGSVAPQTKEVYDLIRRQTMAAFMAPMRTEKVTVQVECRPAHSDDTLCFKLAGKRTATLGWGAAFKNKNSRLSAESDMDAVALEEGLEVVPSVSDAEFSALKELPHVLGKKSMRLEPATVEEKKLTPPLRYSEGGLIDELKRNGVGRPSTYPMIVKTLLARNYITVQNGRCETTEVGRLLVDTAKSTFPSIVDIGFTSNFEQKLDRVAKPEGSDHAFLRNYRQLTEADYVLSSFISNFLNYVTEATRVQSSVVAERSLRLKQSSSGSATASTTPSDTDIAAERQRVAAQVPEVVDLSRIYRTFTALQNALNDYLRRHFPAATVGTVGRTPAPLRKSPRPISFTASRKQARKKSSGKKKKN